MEMLITQALDERDLLAKKINDAINSQEFVSLKKKSKDIDYNNCPVDKITEDIKSTYQSILDMSKRYCSIIQKIAESNAVTKINVNGQEMTISAAISILKDIKDGSYFEAKLLKKLERDYDMASKYIKSNNDKVEINRNTLLNNIMARNDSKKPSEQEVSLVDATLAGDWAEYIDPLTITDKIKELREKTTDFKSRILSAIKISNATTVINID